MLKVGIFGDSYADPIRHGHDNFRELDELGWPNLLKRKYEVGLHAKTGSSIFYSYQQFMKYHEQYDKIVFVITNPSRWVKSVSISGEEKHMSTYHVVEQHLQRKSVLSPDEICILEALKSYYLYLQDDESDEIFCQLMINHMRQLRPDIILIPIGRMLLDTNAVSFSDYSIAFHSGMPFSTGNPDDWGFRYGNFLKDHYEYRLVCHFSPEINEMIANDVLTALETGKWDPELPKPIKHKYNSDYYWDKISNLPR